jgi:hypothetical protein
MGVSSALANFGEIAVVHVDVMIPFTTMFPVSVCGLYKPEDKIVSTRMTIVSELLPVLSTSPVSTFAAAVNTPFRYKKCVGVSMRR